jgi:hypothetical protein
VQASPHIDRYFASVVVVWRRHGGDAEGVEDEAAARDRGHEIEGAVD